MLVADGINMFSFLKKVLFDNRDPHTFSSDGVRRVRYRPGVFKIRSLRRQWRGFVEHLPDYPGNFYGRGIVICAGGIKYFTCVWVCVNMLRKLGCQLPIEIWYSGSELNSEVISELEKFNVSCKNSYDFYFRKLSGFALKPFAIINSSFREVLYLDADNNCLADPAFLFDSKEYRDFGAVFWPDFWKTEKSNPIWKIVNSEYSAAVEQESGQILINKEIHWKALNLCLFFNMNSGHYYRMLLGDKDTFKFAWIGLRSPYYMISTPVGSCGYRDEESGRLIATSMVQHDFQGNILFVHRNLLKWDITLPDGQNGWQEICRYKRNAREMKMIYEIDHHIAYISVDGDVESESFNELFGDYELRCLQILNDLRESQFFRRFMLHIYYSQNRRGYKPTEASLIT